MKIQREVNGQVMEFELTSEELFAAFEEQEHLFDIQDVKNKFESELDPNEFEETHGFPMDLVMGNQDLLEEMAWESRHNQDKHGMEWEYARDDAIKDIIEKHRDELEAAAKEKEQEVGAVRIHEGLPDMCYSTLESTGELIIIERGEPGYRKAWESSDYAPDNREMADVYNDKLGVTKNQRSAMEAGALFGWHVPMANPKMYDEDGKLDKKQHPTLSLNDQIESANQLKKTDHMTVGSDNRDLDLSSR